MGFGQLELGDFEGEIVTVRVALEAAEHSPLLHVRVEHCPLDFFLLTEVYPFRSKIAFLVRGLTNTVYCLRHKRCDKNKSATNASLDKQYPRIHLSHCFALSSQEFVIFLGL